MKINVTNQLAELDGTGMEILSGLRNASLCGACSEVLRKAMQPLTLRLVCTRALTSAEHNQGLSSEEKFKRGQMAHKIYNSDEPSLSADDVVRLKKAIGNYDGPLVVLQAFELLDPPDDEAAGDD